MREKSSWSELLGFSKIGVSNVILDTKGGLKFRFDFGALVADLGSYPAFTIEKLRPSSGSLLRGQHVKPYLPRPVSTFLPDLQNRMSIRLENKYTSNQNVSTTKYGRGNPNMVVQSLDNLRLSQSFSGRRRIYIRFFFMTDDEP